MLQRQLAPLIANRLQRQPAVALLGPRQVGKTTLARQVAAGMPNAVFLDLELEADRARLARPDLFFARHRDELLGDELQAAPATIQP